VTFRPGELDQRIELQKETRTPDGQGGFTKIWQTQTEVWAHVRPLRGSERQHSDRKQAEGGYLVVIRYRSDVNESWRVNWLDAGKVMDITFAQDGGRRSAYLPLECTRGVAT
jgi:SPP1 family predicted phage head-tail adaptor